LGTTEEQAKAEGQEIVATEEPSQATNVVDLMEVLQGSVAAVRGRRAGGGEPR
jgi:DNA end-binding protein Ku